MSKFKQGTLVRLKGLHHRKENGTLAMMLVKEASPMWQAVLFRHPNGSWLVHEVQCEIITYRKQLSKKELGQVIHFILTAKYGAMLRPYVAKLIK